MSWLSTLAMVDDIALGKHGDLLGAVPVTYVSATGITVTPVQAMCEQAEVLPTDGPAGVSRIYETLFMRLADLPGIDPTNDNPRITILPPAPAAGSVYKSTRQVLDNMGGVRLYLTPVQP